MPQQMRERFERHGQSAFVPYIDPFATLARGEEYTRAGHAVDIADAENAFFNELPAITENPSGFQDFLQKNPMATFSPMVATYQKLRQPVRKDPFEAIVAKEGSDLLKGYRAAIQAGEDPMQAFSKVRDVVMKRREASKASKDDELFFVEKGGDLEDFEELKAKGATRAQMLDHIHKKGKPLTATEARKLSELQTGIDAVLAGLDNAEDKEAAFEEAKGHKPKTEQEWRDAYEILKGRKLAPKQKEYDDYLTILEENGKRIPGRKPIAPAANVPHGTLPIVPAATPEATGLPIAPPPTGPPAVPVIPAGVSPFDGGPTSIRTAPIPPAAPPAAIGAPPPLSPVKKPGLSPLSQVRQALKP